jgi:hypothetical protein
MYIASKNGAPKKANRNATSRYRAKLRRKNTRRKQRVSGRNW